MNVNKPPKGARVKAIALAACRVEVALGNFHADLIPRVPTDQRVNVTDLARALAVFESGGIEDIK